MPDDSTTQPMVSTRRIAQISMLGLAFLLPFLTWIQAAGAAVLMLLFNLYILPQIAAAYVSPELVIYPLSVPMLILLYRNHIAVVAGVWAIVALGDGAAGVAGNAWRGPSLPWNQEKTWRGFLSFILASTLGAYALTRWAAPSLAAVNVLMVCAATAVVGAVVESLRLQLDARLTVPLVLSAFMFCAYLIDRSALAGNLPYLRRRILLALAVNLLFAFAASLLKLLTRSGAAAGMVLGIAVYLGYGYKSFLIVFAFFLLGSMATRMGYAKKAARGLAERRGGARSWREAAANSLAGAYFAILAITTPYATAFLVALVAAFSEAAGDTVSSEMGQWLSERAYRITTFELVPAGENGAVSAAGTLAGGAASALVVGLGYALGLCGRLRAPGRAAMLGAAIALGAALAGNLLDSLLGATLERRGLVTNGIVNFAGTSFAGALALVAALRLRL